MVTTERGTVVIDRGAGHDLSWAGERAGPDCRRPELDLYRAPTDNDKYMLLAWGSARLAHLETSVRSVEIVEQSDSRVTIVVQFGARAAGVAAGLPGEDPVRDRWLWRSWR